MSSPSASSVDPNPSSISIRSTGPVPPSPSTSTATQPSTTTPSGSGPAANASSAPPSATSPTTTSNPQTLQAQTQRSNPQLTAQAHTALTTALTSIGNKHLSPLQSRAQDIHANAEHISTQQTNLEKSTSALAKDATAMEKETGRAGEVLKGLGDLQNWAEMMEWELGVLERTMDRVEGIGDEGSEQGSEGEWEDDLGEEEEQEDGDHGPRVDPDYPDVKATPPESKLPEENSLHEAPGSSSNIAVDQSATANDAAPSLDKK